MEISDDNDINYAPNESNSETEGMNDGGKRERNLGNESGESIHGNKLNAQKIKLGENSIRQ